MRLPNLGSANLDEAEWWAWAITIALGLCVAIMFTKPPDNPGAGYEEEEDVRDGEEEDFGDEDDMDENDDEDVDSADSGGVMLIEIDRDEDGQDLGIKVKRDESGLRVDAVSSGGPASGLLFPGDIIIEVNGMIVVQPVTTSNAGGGVGGFRV